MVKKSISGGILPGKNDSEDFNLVARKVPAVVGIHPAGSIILVELVSAEAVMATKLVFREDAKVGSEQAYIVEFGPCVKPEEVNLKVGDRILLGVRPQPLQEAKQFTDKKLALIEIHNIKARLEEAK